VNRPTIAPLDGVWDLVVLRPTPPCPACGGPTDAPESVCARCCPRVPERREVTPDGRVVERPRWLT
jgi:hypothetical protein